MTYIIFDLEALLTHNEKMFPYIIEIGAVKVEEINGDLEITDTFNSYVKPPCRVNNRNLDFIGAKNLDIMMAPPLYKVLLSFRKWINEKNYYLCSWSSSDMDILAKNKLYQTDTFGVSWVKNYNDIQKIISNKYSSDGNMLSLANATEIILGSKDNIRFHSAMTDSFGTALLFIECYDFVKNELKTNPKPLDEYIELTKRNVKKREEKALRLQKNSG